MKKNILNLLKTTYLIDEGASKNWKFITFLFILATIMITASHQVDSKVYQIANSIQDLQRLKSEFVTTRSQLMHLKMKTAIEKKLLSTRIESPNKPATIIYVQIDG